jgi:DNA-binding transcriptional LysR family regulator
MARENYSDLLAFLAVAQERSFTKAARKMNISQSALSHVIKNLETRLGTRLLMRNTRSVSTTEAGEHLVQSLGPRFLEIDAEIEALGARREKTIGLVRITATEHPIDEYIWPRLSKILPKYPDLQVELSIDYGLSNIIDQKFDIGVRFGDQVEKDMIAVRISADVKMAIVGSPEYFRTRKIPKSPEDLLPHNCIRLRLASRGTLYAWELSKADQNIEARVEGAVICNSALQMLNCALSGAGLAYLPETQVLPFVKSGQLKLAMKDWSSTFPGYHAYYSSRRQMSRAITTVIDALRHSPPL